MFRPFVQRFQYRAAYRQPRHAQGDRNSISFTLRSVGHSSQTWDGSRNVPLVWELGNTDFQICVSEANERSGLVEIDNS